MLIYSLLYVHIHHALRVQIVYQVNIRIENRKLRGRINILYWTKKKIPRPPLAQIWAIIIVTVTATLFMATKIIGTAMVKIFITFFWGSSTII